MDYSKRHANIRSTFAGHWVIGLGHLAKGDFQTAIESLKTAAQIAKDPFYLVTAKYFLVVSYIMSEQFDQADDVVKEVLSYSQAFGCELFGNMAIGLQGVVMIVQGHMAKGLSQLEAVLRTFRKKGCTATCGMLEYILGKIYCQIATGPKPAFSVMAKNLGFLVKNVPLATQKAEEHLNKAIEHNLRPAPLKQKQDQGPAKIRFEQLSFDFNSSNPIKKSS